MSPRRDPRISLGDILDAATKATQFVDGLSFEEFAEDDRTVFAVVRALEIVGEATKGVPPRIRDRAPGLPWREMAGMRDKLIHAYHGVDLKVVWRTAKNELPIVIAEIRNLLEKGS